MKLLIIKTTAYTRNLLSFGSHSFDFVQGGIRWSGNPSMTVSLDREEFKRVVAVHILLVLR